MSRMRGENCRPTRSKRLKTNSEFIWTFPDRPIAEVHGFLRHLGARACSPNTLCAYAHDLLHFYQFLELTGLNVDVFGPPESLTLLEHLRRVPSRRPTGRLDLVLATTVSSGGSATRLAPATVNRIFAAISS